MILDDLYKDAFYKDEKPLQKLEEAFNAAGWHIKFELFLDPNYGKLVKVIGGCASQTVICIEVDSPAMAVKDVAKGVRLW